MATMDDPVKLKKLFETYGKAFAESASKHWAASSSAEAGKPKGYQETVSRGGAADGEPVGGLQRGGGRLKSARDLEKSVKELAEAIDAHKFSRIFSRVGNAIGIFANTLAHPKQAMTDFNNERREMILESAKEFGEMQVEAHRKMIESLTNYIKQDETDFSKLGDTPKELERLNMRLHELMNDVSAGPAEFKKLFDEMKELKNATVGAVDIFELLDDGVEEVLTTMATAKRVDRPGEDASPEHKAAWKRQQEAAVKLSSAMEETSDVMVNATQRITSNIGDIMEAHRAKMNTVMKGLVVVSGVGGAKWMDDILYRYQANIAESYHMAGVQMGMSHREVQDGMRQYRDALRMDVVGRGGSIYDEASEQAMMDIANIGDAFGLAGAEGFDFGMKMKEAAAVTGLAARLNTDSMRRFYKESANTVGMTVQEWGEYFNDMAKDPAFSGFINNLRMMGGDTQEILEKELGLRVRMNKLLGLSNENLQQRINLENAQKWAPIVDKFKAMIGAGELARKYEQVLGIELTDEQKDVLKKYAFDPSNLTESQRKLFTETIQPLMTRGPALFEEYYTKMIQDAEKAGNESEVRRLTMQKATAQEQVNIFGGMAKENLFNLQQSEQSVAAAQSMAEQLGMSVKEFTQRQTSGNITEDMRQAIATYTGTSDKMMGAKDQGYDQIGTAEFIYMRTKELLQGAAASSLVQTFSSLAAGVGGLALQYAQYRLLMSALGTKTGAVTGVLSTVAQKAGPLAGKLVSRLAAGLVGVKNGILGFGGILKTIATYDVGGLFLKMAGGMKNSILGFAGMLKNINVGGVFLKMAGGMKTATGALINSLSGAGGVFLKMAGSMKTATGSLIKSLGGLRGSIGKVAFGKLGMLGLAATIGATIGRLGYEWAKDKDWFTDGADAVFGFMDKINPWAGDKTSQAELDAANIEAVNNARRNRLRTQLEKTGQGHLLEGMTTTEVDRRLGLETAAKALGLAEQAMEEAARIKEPEVGKSGMTQTELMEGIHDELQESNKLTRDKIKEDRVDKEERKTAFQRIEDARASAQESLNNWKSTAEDAILDARIQYA